MTNREDDLTWLQRHTEEYRASMFHANEAVEDFDQAGKLR
jgi:hypothetical protein